MLPLLEDYIMKLLIIKIFILICLTSFFILKSDRSLQSILLAVVIIIIVSIGLFLQFKTK